MLDKLVPAYYHRLEKDGSICGSAFGANTAGGPQYLTHPPQVLNAPEYDTIFATALQRRLQDGAHPHTRRSDLRHC